MNAKLPSNPTEPPPFINSITTLAWLERVVKLRLNKLLGETWGQTADRFGEFKGNTLFQNAHASVRASFLTALLNNVLHDVLKSRRTFDDHSNYMNSLASGNFDVVFSGKFDDEQKAALTPVIYELAKTCVASLQSLPLPHLQKPMEKRDINPSSAATPSQEVKPAAAPIPPKEVKVAKSALDPREFSQLSLLMGRIKTAIQSSNSQTIEKIITKLNDKSVTLRDEIRALERAEPTEQMAHNIFLKREHRRIIIEGIAHAKAHARKLAADTIPILPQPPKAVPPVVTQPVTDTIPQPFARPARLCLKTVTKIREHRALVATALASVATGVALVFNLIVSPTDSITIPTANAGQSVTKIARSVAATPVATPAAASAATTPIEASTVARNFVAAQLENAVNPFVTTAKAATMNNALVVPLKSAANDVYKAPAIKQVRLSLPKFADIKPASVAGVVFERTTAETLSNMCSQGFKTWACEHQPA